MKATVACLFLAFLAVSAVGQVAGDPASGAFGLIIHAEGSDFGLVRNGRRSIYNTGRDEVVGLPLFPGDLIQTENDTYLEIQLLPSKSVLKVAENTAFEVVGLSADGAGIFDVTYGRIRAQVGALTGDGPFEIRGAGAATADSGADFGYDYVVDLSRGDIVSAIYCFDGEIRVTPPVGDGSSVGEQLTLGPNQMVTVGSATAAVPTPPFEQTETTASIEQFWTIRDFVAKPIEPGDVGRRFPNLQSSVAEALGTTPAFLGGGSGASAVESAAKPAVASATVVELDRTQATQIVGRDAPDAELSGGPGFWAVTTGVIGYTLTGAGIVADVAAIGLYFFGSYIIPGWDAALAAEFLPWVLIGGSGSFVVGITSLLISLQLSR